MIVRLVSTFFVFHDEDNGRIMQHIVRDSGYDKDWVMYVVKYLNKRPSYFEYDLLDHPHIRKVASGTQASCTVMNKVHPTFQRHSLLAPQLLHRISQCLRSPLVMKNT